MTLIIKKDSGEVIDLEAIGIKVLEFEPQPLKPRSRIENAGSRYVVIEDGYEPRFIDVVLTVAGRDMDDYALRRAELFDLFVSEQPFYLLDGRMLDRQWLVKSADFTNTRNRTRGQMSLAFLCINKYSESTGTSLQLADRNFDSGLWGWGSRINIDEEYQYTFNTNEFTVVNIGNATVDPRESFLNITIKATASSYLQIENLTTGDVYRFNESLTSEDELQLKGVQTFKNGVSSFAKTNRKLLTLEPGENQIKFTGGTVNTVDFDFRFLYK